MTSFRNTITRMPKPPTANYDDQPETVEISSDEEEEEEEDQDDDVTPPTARGSRKDQTSGETEIGEGDVDMDDDEGYDESQPSEAKKRRTGVRNIREQFDRMIEEATQANFCFQCGGEHSLALCPHRDDNLTANALNRTRTIMEDKSRTARATRGRKDKLPKKGVMPQASDGTELASLRKRRFPRATTTNLPTCLRLEIVKRVGPYWPMELKSIEKGKGCRIEVSLIS